MHSHDSQEHQNSKDHGGSFLDVALRRLDPEWRAVVVLHYFLGMPLPDVAATLGIPLGTAKSRLHRSLTAMRVAIVSDETGPMPVPGGQFA